MSELPGTGMPRDVARARARDVSFVAIVLTGLAAIAFSVVAPVRVTVDGVERAIAAGTSVGDLERAHGLAAPRGNLVSVNGKVLERGAGGAPTIFVDGSVGETATVLRTGDVVVSSPGPDVVEATETVTLETTPTVRFVGSGPVASIEVSGSPGRISVVVGAASREEVSRTRVSKGTPTLVRRRSAGRGKRVALTFDDGPWPKSTAGVLKVLAAHRAKATFFVVGRQIAARSALVRRLQDAGMEIGNHSYSHRYLYKSSAATARSEIGRADDAIAAVTGERPLWYRPAGGATNPFVYQEAGRLGHKIVLWTVDPKDWRRPGTHTIARRVLANVRPGAVILLHDGGGNRAQTVSALKLILRGLERRGYKAVTLSQLFGE